MGNRARKQKSEVKGFMVSKNVRDIQIGYQVLCIPVKRYNSPETVNILKGFDAFLTKLSFLQFSKIRWGLSV